MTDTALIGLLHLLLAGYWLGADLAVYLIAAAVADGRHPAPVRQFAARFMLLVDMVPRTCLVLALASGAHLAIRYFAPQGVALLPWLWVATGSWLALVWALYLRQQGGGAPRAWVLLDTMLRLVVIIALLVFAGLCFQRGVGWLALKLVLFALIVTLGLIVRWQLRRFGPLFQASLAASAGERERVALRRLIAQVKIPVWGIWLSVLAAALLGQLKPNL